jgi:hypothetical protein
MEGVWTKLLRMGLVVNALAEIRKRRFAVEMGLRGRRRLMQYAQNAGHDDEKIEECVNSLCECSELDMVVFFRKAQHFGISSVANRSLPIS